MKAGCLNEAIIFEVKVFERNGIIAMHDLDHTIKKEIIKKLKKESKENYFIHFFDDVPDNCMSGIIGLIGNFANKQFKIRIEIDDDYMMLRKRKECCLHIENSNINSGCAVVLTSSFWNALKEHNFLTAAIWHEIGLYHICHYFNQVFDAIIMNSYSPTMFSKENDLIHEKAADLFAAYYTSLQDVEDELEWIIARIPSPTNKKYGNLIEIEYLLKQREMFLSNITHSEEIPQIMCSLCGANRFNTI